MATEVVFGYTHINWPGFKPCPCGDPGNYCRFEVRDGHDTITCWCGNSMRILSWARFEREEFIKQHLNNIAAREKGDIE